jgi:hypothetical protein
LKSNYGYGTFIKHQQDKLVEMKEQLKQARINQKLADKKNYDQDLAKN